MNPAKILIGISLNLPFQSFEVFNSYFHLQIGLLHLNLKVGLHPMVETHLKSNN